MSRPVGTLVGTIARRLFPAALLLLGAGTFAAAAGKVTIKLGTLAPRGTSYHKTLMALGEKWRTTSGGVVKLVVFPDGTQGGEADMVGLMQTGSLDAGMLTGVGLSEIEKGVAALGGTPMNYRNLDELEYVIEKLRPTLEKRMLEKGFVVLFWGDSGFVRFFSKQPLVHPDDLRRAKFFCWAGNAEEFDLWKSAGYHPVALETVNIMPSLQTGLIDTVAMPPFFALASQLDAQASNMLLLNWGPLVGGTVVTRKTWEKIPAELRPALLKTAADAGREIKAAGRAENERSVEALKKRGVKVTVPTPEIEAEWRKAVDPYRDKIRGRLVPADLFDEVARFLKEYRSQAGAAGR